MSNLEKSEYLEFEIPDLNLEGGPGRPEDFQYIVKAQRQTGWHTLPFSVGKPGQHVLYK